jgi:hypothetical protein
MSDSESVTDSDFASGSIADMEPDPAGPMFPLVATYVVLTIDPVATLASLDDPEVTVAAGKLHPKKYVGYVGNVCSLLFSYIIIVDVSMVRIAAIDSKCSEY